MSDTYSRVGYLAIKKETTENTAVTPNVFIPFNDESAAVEYGYTPAIPVSGSRALNRRAVKKRITAPAGTINVNVEPKTFGYFLEAILGDLISGNYVKISNVVGTFNTTNVVTFVGSAATATPVFIGDDFIIFGAFTGTPANTDTLSQAVSGATADVDEVDGAGTVKGHAAKLPANFSNTFTMEFGYSDRAHRLVGVKFHSIDAFGQSDDIITAGIQFMARSAFRQARVTAITTSGAGAKTITVDTTQGLVASDSIKLYRDGSGFLDFEAASDAIHTITSLTANTIVVTNLQTSTAIGDLIVLAPQTPTYTIDSEFSWVGGSQVSLGNTKASFATENVEDFTISILNELEERHAASGTNLSNRFPTALLQKGLTANGSFALYNQDEGFIRHLRLTTAQAAKLQCTGGQIGATGIYYQLQIIFPEVQFDPYQLSLSQDDLVNEEIPFSAFCNTTAAYSVQILLVNNVTVY